MALKLLIIVPCGQSKIWQKYPKLNIVYVKHSSYPMSREDEELDKIKKKIEECV